MKKNYLIYIVIFFLLTAIAAFAYSINLYLNNTDTLNQKETVSSSQFKSTKLDVDDFPKNNSTKIAQTNIQTKDESYDLKDAEHYIKAQEEIKFKMNALLINTKTPSTIDQSCPQTSDIEKAKCKEGLFIGCADSLYLGSEMTPECRQFNTSDYMKYLDAKKKMEAEKTIQNQYISSDIGDIYISNNEYDRLDNPDLKETINSSTVNNNYEPDSVDQIQKQEETLKPTKLLDFTFSYNKTAKASNFTGWITGWGTLFAILGGKKEAGFKMNAYTAFGYNPYKSTTCIVSLPYKTVDKFFGTTLNTCVKTGNVACVSKIKEEIRNRAIEVVMIKNGKHAVFPLGDFGPAEWTGNAIDFTSCAQKVLGATGKDLVRFRPLPQ